MVSLTKVLVLAIDAFDGLLLKKWAADGTLPNLARILKKGLVGDTRSLDGLFVGATWPSFYTGVSPARHGIHSWIQLQPGSYNFFRCSAGEHVKREPFWNHLSRAGRKIAILDVPLATVTDGLRGIQIQEWGCHDAASGFATSPPALKDVVLRRFGRYPLTESCDSFARTAEGVAMLRDVLIRGVKRKAELTSYFLTHGGWDLFVQVFTEAHCAGHQYWNLHDPYHPSHDPAVAAAIGDPVRDVYVAIDKAVADIWSQLGDEVIVILLATHGMTHRYGAPFLLPEILVRLQVAQRLWRRNASLALSNTAADILGWGWAHTPWILKQKLETLRQSVRTRLDEQHARFFPSRCGLDLETSKCFPLENGFPVGGLRVNLSGREPNGLVRPGSEMDDFCTELSNDLFEIVDADTGRPVIDKICKTADLYPGDALDNLPDLLIEWNGEKALSPLGSVRLSSDKIGSIEGTYDDCRTGDHVSSGMFIALGPGIRAGQLERPVSIMDFAPTLTSLLGVPLADVDGRVIHEISRNSSTWLE